MNSYNLIFTYFLKSYFIKFGTCVNYPISQETGSHDNIKKKYDIYELALKLYLC